MDRGGHRCTTVYRGVPGCTGVYWGVPRCTTVYRGVLPVLSEVKKLLPRDSTTHPAQTRQAQMRASYKNGCGSRAWFARMPARFARISTSFPRGAVNRIFFWMHNTNLHSHYKPFPRCVEALRASWDAINCSIEAERQASAWCLMLVDGLGGYSGLVA